MLICPSCKKQEGLMAQLREDLKNSRKKALYEALEIVSPEEGPDDCESPKCGYDYLCPPCQRIIKLIEFIKNLEK